MRYILWPAQVEAERPVGGKARSLLRLTRAGLPVPDWFVVLNDAFYASLTEGARAAMAGAREPESVRQALEDLAPAEVLREELAEAVARLCPRGELLAVRSSALEEDSVALSFAGQLESYIFVAPEEVGERLAAVWRSGFSERMFAYRRVAGLDPVPKAPAAVVQRAIDGEVSGVAFSADPVSGRRGIAVVSAVLGHGETLVSGGSDADTWHIDRAGALVKPVADRSNVSARPDWRTPVPEDQRTRQALDHPAVLAVAALARRAERLFGRPQDIEWTIEHGRLHLLQSRPITALADKPDPDAGPALWDNSNIAENFSGVTTPLTFSFVRRIYEEVFCAFCRHMGVPSRVIDEHASAFRCMVGLVRGRIYYNLLSWYRVLALLPAFKANRTFLEQMLGVTESLAESAAVTIANATARTKLAHVLGVARSACTFAVNYVTVRRRVTRFLGLLDVLLSEEGPELSAMRPDELVAHYRKLERRLSSVSSVPPLNDFYVMVLHGLLRKCARRWLGADADRLVNDLLCGDEGTIATELAARVARMAQLAAQRSEFVDLLCEGGLPAIEHSLREAPEFEREYRRYLDAFGERCVEELKLESPTLRDDPLPLLRSVGRVARRLRAGALPLPEFASAARVQARVREALGRNVLKRALFVWVLRSLRARLRDREALRFGRTRMFDRTRRIAIELGRRFVALEVLDDPRDVFYLEVEEMLAFVEGWATTTDLKGLAALRQREFQGFQTAEAPGERLETHGIVYVGHHFKGEAGRGPHSGESLHGTGCCPGIVTGPIRIVRDPRRVDLGPGEIIVAERTDPGWTVIFPAAAGLLVERGNILSHAAIAAREIGLPMVVSLPGLTGWLRDGDQVELDGRSGRVVKLRPSGAVEAGHA